MAFQKGWPKNQDFHFFGSSFPNFMRCEKSFFFPASPTIFKRLNRSGRAIQKGQHINLELPLYFYVACRQNKSYLSTKLEIRTSWWKVVFGHIISRQFWFQGSNHAGAILCSALAWAKPCTVTSLCSMFLCHKG